jgi:hypothetical protein
VCTPCDTNRNQKTPDASIFPGDPGRRWLTICLEVGYSETYQELLNDADVLLEGSAGGIRLIKIEPLSPNTSETRQGFVEDWEYDESTGREKKWSAKDRYDSSRISFHFQRITFLRPLSPASQWSFADDIFLLGRLARGKEAGMSGWDCWRHGDLTNEVTP